MLHAQPALSPLAVLIIAIIVFALINPRFLQPQALSILFQQVAIIAALAIGQTLIILTAGIDLSVGAIAVLSSVVMGQFAFRYGLPLPLAPIGGDRIRGPRHLAQERPHALPAHEPALLVPADE